MGIINIGYQKYQVPYLIYWVSDIFGIGYIGYQIYSVSEISGISKRPLKIAFRVTLLIVLHKKINLFTVLSPRSAIESIYHRPVLSK